jgi:hypothetical protein
MKLTYRGISYEYNPPEVAVEQGAVAGKFRGLDWRFRNLKKPLVLQPPANLTYRGVAYSNREVDFVTEQARWLMLDRQKAARNRSESMLKRATDEVGLT